VRSTIGSKPAGGNGGAQQEFYVIVTFRIGLLLGQLCYMAQNVGYKELSCPEDEYRRDTHASLDV